MASDANMKRTRKRKNAQDTTQASKVSRTRERVSTQVSPGLRQAALNECDENEELENQDHSPSKEVVQEDAPASQDSVAEPTKKKKTRGRTKMKDIAVEAKDIVHVDFTEKGEPCGKGSVALSSFLGPLVREHVPVTLEDWRKLDDKTKVILWESIQARFDLKEEWQKDVVFRSMGCLFRASKSRLVSDIQLAKNKEERLQLQPKNIQSTVEWKRFIKAKTSPAFKAISDKYKAIRRKQIPHTCSRKGVVRLREDMKKESPNPSLVSRSKVWVRAHTKKNGQPVNTKVSEIVEKVKEADINSPSSSTTNVREDAVSKVLGPDKPGRLRGMGRGMTISKLAFFQATDKQVTQMQENQIFLKNKIVRLENTLNKIMKKKNLLDDEEEDEDEEASPRSVNTNSSHKCKLLDWSGREDIVAEGRWVSSDPQEFVNQIPLGPNAMKVLVDIPIRPDAFLWRPTSSMFCFEQAKGSTIAWPADKVILQMHQQSEEQDNLSMHSNPYTNSRNKCKLFDWTGNDEIVAEGRWYSSDPKAMVNDIPLGPNAMIVYVDIPKNPEAFLWRPAADMTCIEDAVGSAIAWPANKVVMEKITESQDVGNASSHSSVNTRSNKKCKLLDVGGSGEIVAEGRWSSSDHRRRLNRRRYGLSGTQQENDP